MDAIQPADLVLEHLVHAGSPTLIVLPPATVSGGAIGTADRARAPTHPLLRGQPLDRLLAFGQQVRQVAQAHA